MVNRLVDTGNKYGVEINIENSLIMRKSARNESLWIKVDNTELKGIDHFNYHGRVLTIDTREIKTRNARTKEEFNRKISLFTSKLCIELRKKLFRCDIWSITLFGSETWRLRKLERRYLASFEIWPWRWTENVQRINR